MISRADLESAYCLRSRRSLPNDLKLRLRSLPNDTKVRLGSLPNDLKVKLRSLPSDLKVHVLLLKGASAPLVFTLRHSDGLN